MNVFIHYAYIYHGTGKRIRVIGNCYAIVIEKYCAEFYLYFYQKFLSNEPFIKFKLQVDKRYEGNCYFIIFIEFGFQGHFQFNKAFDSFEKVYKMLQLKTYQNNI